MTKGYYREFGALEELSGNTIREFYGKVIEAGLYLTSRISGAHELTLVRPRLCSKVGGGLKRLLETLDVQKVDTIKVFRQPPRDAARDQGLLWRIEIYKNDNEIVIVRCADIKGLPGREA